MVGLFEDMDGHWLAVRDGDPQVAALLSRHYSYRPYRDNRRKVRRQIGFVPGGERIVLLSHTGDAAFIWRKFSANAEMIEKYGWQVGIGCTFFRNEGTVRSSDLIQEAMGIAWARWPGERLFTFVEDAKVGTGSQQGRAKAGWCYRKAGWKPCGRNADGRLTILEILPTNVAPLLPCGPTHPRGATAGAWDVPTLSGAAARAVAPSTTTERPDRG